MNIMVTGCSGFIGSKVTETLLKEGNHVYGIDNMEDTYDRRLKEWRLQAVSAYDNFHFDGVDITDRKHLAEYIDKIGGNMPGNGVIDAVINLAAKAGVRKSLEVPELYFETNLTGVLNILELCRDNGIERLVQASTSSVYGENEIPFSEQQRTDRQLSPYAASKKASELLCYTYHSLYGINITILRYFTVYGPAGRPDMSPFRFIRWAVEGEDINIYGDGNQSRDFTYVDDIAAGTIRALHTTGYEIVNLGSNSPVKLNHFLDIIKKYTDSSSRTVYHPASPGDVRATWADITKASEILEWNPVCSLEKGISNSVEWYLRNRNWAREIIL